MSVEQNVALAKRWFQEVWNEGRVETVYELFSAEGIAHGQEGAEAELRGPEQFEAFVRKIRGAFPDIAITVEDVFGDGDKVALRWSATMTHSGNTLGVPASGRKVQSRGITMVRFADGKVVEGWDNWDELGMMKQIGAFPEQMAA